MSIIEGGATFRCGIHGFETQNIDEWNDHCHNNPDHTEEGFTQCISCGTDIQFSGLPFHKLGPDGSKNIQLRCEDCENKMMGNVRRVTKKSPQSQQQGGSLGSV